MPTLGGAAARSRPIAVAAGAAPSPRRSASSRIVPSTSRRSVLVSGSGGRFGIVDAIVRAALTPERGGRFADHPRVVLLVDLDGVVYRGTDPGPGVAQLLAERAAAGDDVVYVT